MKAETPTESVSATPRSRWRALVNSAVLLAVASLGSRMLGLLREVVVAARFGTGDELSAYNAAFRIPDLLYLLIIGGALGSAIIPVFGGFLGRGEDDKAWRLANAIINFALATLLVVGLITFVLAPQIVQYILAPGFSPQNQQLTTNIARVLLIQPLLLGLGGIAMALLNGTQHFLWPALAPIFYNLSIIFGALVLAGPLGIGGMVAGVLVGAAIYLAVQLPTLLKLGLRYRPGFDRNAPGLSQIGKALGPRLIGQAAFQINFIVITALASANPATIPALNYGFQLLMLPHGIFAMSVATVAFPLLSRQFGANDSEGFERTLERSLRQIFFFALPASLGLGMLAGPIVRSLFELGNFNRASSNLVADGLVFYALGLVGYGIVEILTRAFYAMHDTRTPVTAAVATIVINIGLSVALIGPLGYRGLALSLAITNTLEMLVLLVLMRRRLGMLSADGSLLVGAFKIALAANVMACFLLAANWLLAAPLADLNKVLLIGLTAVIIGLAGLVYAGAAYLLKIEELQTVLSRIRRR